MENISGSSSPNCLSRTSHSIVFLSNLGGVPVFNLPIFKLKESKSFAKLIEGSSSTRPADIVFSPIWIMPFRKVPVVNITALENNDSPVSSFTPLTLPSLFLKKQPTVPSKTSSPF